MTNDEIRMTNQARMLEGSNPHSIIRTFSELIRHSNFVIRHLTCSGWFDASALAGHDAQHVRSGATVATHRLRDPRLMAAG
jgi:hypothetical protein